MVQEGRNFLLSDKAGNGVALVLETYIRTLHGFAILVQLKELGKLSVRWTVSFAEYSCM